MALVLPLVWPLGGLVAIGGILPSEMLLPSRLGGCSRSPGYVGAVVARELGQLVEDSALFFPRCSEVLPRQFLELPRFRGQLSG
jgi:hypothetical protein